QPRGGGDLVDGTGRNARATDPNAAVTRGRSMPTEQEIFEKVRTTLVGDLNAESIDFLDIVFRLEKQFGVKIPREELFPESIFQGDPQFVTDGKVNEAGLNELQQRMPFADLTEFKKDSRLEKMEDLFTVELIVNYLQRKLGS